MNNNNFTGSNLNNFILANPNNGGRNKIFGNGLNNSGTNAIDNGFIRPDQQRSHVDQAKGENLALNGVNGINPIQGFQDINNLQTTQKTDEELQKESNNQFFGSGNKNNKTSLEGRSVKIGAGSTQVVENKNPTTTRSNQNALDNISISAFDVGDYDLRRKIQDSFDQIGANKVPGSYVGVDVNFGLDGSDAIKFLNDNFESNTEDAFNQLISTVQNEGGNVATDPRIQEFVGNAKEALANHLKEDIKLTKKNYEENGGSKSFLNDKIKILNKLETVTAIKNSSRQELTNSISDSFEAEKKDYQYALQSSADKPSTRAKSEILQLKGYTNFLKTYIKTLPNEQQVKLAKELKKDYIGDLEKKALKDAKEMLEKSGKSKLYYERRFDKGINIDELVPKDTQDLIKAVSLIGETQEDDIIYNAVSKALSPLF